MASFDIIPDIHGHAAKLIHLLGRLGWQKRDGAWRAPDRHSNIVFLGDFIDGGRENALVLQIVRALVDTGRARAIMGNHELNAIHFHSLDPETGQPLRAHAEKNVRMHGSFLAEFPAGSPRAREAIQWFMTLPLWLDCEAFRVIHAYWSDAAIGRLDAVSRAGVLAPGVLIAAGRKTDPFHGDVELLLKGPEVRLPPGAVFHDGAGHARGEVRLAWWRANARTWREAVVSVPNPDELPEGPLSEGAQTLRYHETAPPLFFGHYRLAEPITLEARNALCLDYGTGKDAPLLAYRYDAGDREISLANIVS